MTRCVDGTNCNCELIAGDSITITGNGCSANPYIISSPEALVGASPFTTSVVPNPVAGGTMTQIEFASDDAVIAIKISGDVFPRFLISANDGIYFSDGTFDGYNDVCFIGGQTLGGLNVLALSGPDRISACRDLEIDDCAGLPGTAGVILKAPNATKYRVTVNNAGVLVTTLVP